MHDFETTLTPGPLAGNSVCMPGIAVLDYGMGNIHSILKALRLFHSDVTYTSDPARIRSSEALVLPGDGAFEAAMEGLAPSRDLILQHVSEDKPLFGICIGFQVLFEDSSECESGIIPGLGLLNGNIRRFQFQDPDIRVPHMGWNRLIPSSLADKEYYSDYMYFIHSYRAENTNPSEVVASCDYAGDTFPAVVRKDSILACQFHPEKSGDHGLFLIRDWVSSLSA